jgi:energy-coupling factor transporter ATP-binding protein EcfA2/predicted metal-dependent phosphoesterase TrpH
MNNIDNNWNWVGAKWWKFDFHSHTPASSDYGKGLNQAEFRTISAKDWLLNYMRAGIDCVAVTDHNSGAWIDNLKQALCELIEENPPEFRQLVLFPGVEISVQGIHILAIFPCEKSTSDIDSLLGAVKFRGIKGTTDKCSEVSVLDAINEIHEAGGIAIPAHVDEVNGLFKSLSGSVLEPILNNEYIVAIEVKNRSTPKPQIYTDKKISWSEVLGTDSHHPVGGDTRFYPGSHFTWIKMSIPSFEGLKLALIDGDLSLKRSDIYSGNPNQHSSLIIEKIEITDAKYIGRGNSFVCKFNPWLNTIIGGRGTGKSTIAEFLRIAMKRKEELPSSLKNDFDKYSQISTSRDDDGLLVDSSNFNVYYRKDDDRFRIKWSSSDNVHIIEEEVSPNIWNVLEGDIRQRFPLRIYSQKQIFEIAKQPQALLQIVDDSEDVNFRDWELDLNILVSKYLSICAKEREIQSGLWEESVIRGQLDDVKRKLDVFEKTGNAEILQSYHLSQNQKKSIESWEHQWTDTASQLKIWSEKILPIEIHPYYLSSENEGYDELMSEISTVSDSFRKFQSDLLNISVQIDCIRKAWFDHKDSLIIKKQIDDATSAYTTLMGELSSVGAENPFDYGKFVTQKQELEDKIKGFSEQRTRLLECQQEVVECLNLIQEHRIQITQSRINFLNNILEGNSYVRINVLPYGNTAVVENELRHILGIQKGSYSKDVEEIILPLSNIDKKPMEEIIEDLKKYIFSIHMGNVETKQLKDKRFSTHIQGLTPEHLDRLMCWFPTDSLNLEYRFNDKDSFKSIEKGSPGQKTAALLAFILTYGNEPLILDQPEDDLDNHLIYNLIVTQLREIKQHRQIIIVTHNANIVVNGDAENVITLNTRSGLTNIFAQDCLQEKTIRDEICILLEGGKTAFDLRYKRINAS